MNNPYASIFFLQKFQFKAALPLYSQNFKSGNVVAQLKKSSFISNSSLLESNLLFAYRLIEANTFLTQGSKKSQISINPLIKSFVAFTEFSQFTTFTKAIFADAFSLFFAYQVSFAIFYIQTMGRLAFTPRSLFFFSNYFSLFSNSIVQSKLCLTQKDRFLYAEVIACFFQTGTFFSGHFESASPFFSLFATRNTVTNTSKFGRVYSATKLYSSGFSRRYLVRNSKVNQSLKNNLQAFRATKVISTRRDIAKRKTVSIATELPFFYRRYFRVSLSSIIRSKRSKITKKVGSFIDKQVKVKNRTSQIVYFKLFPSIAEEDYANIKVFSQLKYLLSSVTNARFSLYFVNALSLARFAFDLERHLDAKSKGALTRKSEKKENRFSKVKLSQRFLFSLERERASRFRYVGVYIQDLIRVSFFARYLKKVNFLAFFYAFTLSKLPRNRKETKFLRFLRKLVKVFASQREERVGVRIRFQGRVNR